MRQSIIWIAILMIPLAVVGGMEKRYQALDAKLDQTVKHYKKRIDVIIEDAAKMEGDLAKSRLHRSRPHQDDLTSKEFLQLLTDYMAADGRCDVVVHKTDWSTWKRAHR